MWQAKLGDIARIAEVNFVSPLGLSFVGGPLWGLQAFLGVVGGRVGLHEWRKNFFHPNSCDYIHFLC